jgi:hypothetical protein
MSTRKVNGATYRYYRCSYHANRGGAVFENSRMVPMGVVEAGVLDILSDQLFTRETVEAILEEYRMQTEIEAGSSHDGVKDLEKRIQTAIREAQNLTEAIKAGGPILDLVQALKECRVRRTALELELADLEAVQPPRVDERISRQRRSKRLSWTCVRRSNLRNRRNGSG